MNENETKEPVVSADTVESDMVAAFAEEKKNMVSKSEFEKVVKLNQQLTKQLLTNKVEEEPTKVEFDLKKECQQLNSDMLAKKRMTNLEYCKKMIAIREAAIEQGHRDPILSTDPHSVPSEEEIAVREAVYSTMKDCVDKCHDDPDLFNSLMRKAAPR